MKNLITKCDKLYFDWIKGTYPDKPYVPEPYYGNPDKCSVVMLNLNPGPATCYWQSQRALPNGEKTYSQHALPFPYLNPSLRSLNCGGDSWWEKRNKWLSSLINNTNKNDELYPFALELYPWHTNNWSSVKKSDVDSYIRNYDIFKIADSASKKSLLPNMVFAVGKAYCDILEKHGFCQILYVDNTYYHTVLNKIGVMWPTKAKRPVNRTYEVFCSPEYDSTFIVTWAPGSNNAPSKDFQDVEKALIAKVQELLKNKSCSACNKNSSQSVAKP